MIRATSPRVTLTLAALAITLAGWVAVSVRSTPDASAHPLGNFTVNLYSRLELYSDAILVRYVVDMAEIPAFQEAEVIDQDDDGELSDDESSAYLETAAATLADGLSLSINGTSSELRLLTSDVSYPEGQAGLDTLRIALSLRSEVDQPTVSIEYLDTNYNDRIGWREIVVLPAEGAVLIESTVPEVDVSSELTAYPDDGDTPDVSSAVLAADVSGAQQAPTIGDQAAEWIEPSESASPPSESAFASLIDVENITVPVIIVALLAAFAFGAIHALEPGHGKTLVAAYFVGIKGTASQALALGLIIAATHTVGVLLIAAVTIFGSQYVLAEDLYPWLSLAAGLMVLALGLRLVLTRMSGLGVVHRIAHRIGHHHHDHPTPAREQEGAPPWRSLIALGLADGLVPSPSTLVVLLAAVSLDRVGLGLALVVAFSVGLAVVLTLVSLAMVFTRRFSDRLSTAIRSRRNGVGMLDRISAVVANPRLTATYLPIAGALALVAVGAMLTVRALPSAGLVIGL